VRGRAAGEGGGMRLADPGGEAVGVVVERFRDEDPLAHDHVAVPPGVRAGERAELGEQLVRKAETDATLAPDHREDGTAGEEGVAAEHAADRDLREVGGEVVEARTELEEEGAHGRGAGGGGVYLLGAVCPGT